MRYLENIGDTTLGVSIFLGLGIIIGMAAMSIILDFLL